MRKVTRPRFFCCEAPRTELKITLEETSDLQNKGHSGQGKQAGGLFSDPGISPAATVSKKWLRSGSAVRFFRLGNSPGLAHFGDIPISYFLDPQTEEGSLEISSATQEAGKCCVSALPIKKV